MTIKSFIEERIAALLDFGKVLDSSQGANNSVELEVQGDVDDDGSAVGAAIGTQDAEEYPTAEVWDNPAVQWRPVDEDLNGHCEYLFWRRGDEIVVLAGKERRWQVTLAKGEVVVRGLASGSELIRFKIDGTIELGDGATAKAAREGDLTIADTTMDTWIDAVTTYINGIAPATLVLPTDFGVIDEGSDTVKIKD